MLAQHAPAHRGIVDDLTAVQAERLSEAIASPRGLLALWPADVIAVINGQPITVADKLHAKRERNARNLARKRELPEVVVRPCFVWVFDNGPVIPYGGKWTYIRTLRQSWCIDRRHDAPEWRLKTMETFPCGFLPLLLNYRRWQAAFLQWYHRPTRKNTLIAVQ